MTPFEFFLSAFLIAFVLSIVLIYIIGIYWRKDAKALVNTASYRLRKQQRDIQNGECKLSKFEQSKTLMPYAAHYDLAKQNWIDAKSQLEKNHHQYAELRTLFQKQLKKTPRIMLFSPYYWFETRRSFLRFTHDAEKTSLLINEMVQNIEELSFCETAIITEAQKIWAEFTNLSELLHFLTLQIHGPKFNELLEHFEEIRKELITIPPNFFEVQPENDGENQIDQRQVAAVYQLIQKQRNSVQALIFTSETWEIQINLIEQALLKLQEKHKQLAQKMVHLSTGVNSPQLLETLNECKSQIHTLRERSRRFESGDMRYFLRESRQIDRILDSLDQETENTLMAFNLYVETKKTLTFSLQKLKKLAYQLHNSPFLPIAFDDSKNIMNAIGREYQSLIGSAEKSTIEILETDIKAMGTLLEECETHLPILQVLQDAHAELILLLRRLVSKDMDTWLLNMHAILKEIKNYPPQNYHLLPVAKDMDISSALNEVKQTALDKLPEMTETIREDQVFPTLAEAKKIEELRSLINDALRSQQDQYQKLSELEKTSREKLVQIKASHEHLNSILLGNHSLEQNIGRFIRAAGKNREILENQLNQISHGTIEEESKAIDNLYQHQLKELSNWIVQNQQNSKDELETLQEIFKQIKSLANITDPAINDAKDFIHQKSAILESDDNIEGVDLLALTDRFEDSNHIRQEINDHHQLLEKTLNQARTTTQSFDAKQYNCEKKMREAESYVNPDGWNQRKLNFDRVCKEFDTLEKSKNRFYQDPNSLRRFIVLTDQMGMRFSSIESKFDLIIEEAIGENQLIEEAESAFEITMTLWTKLSDQHQMDRIARSNLQSMMQKYHQKFNNQRNRFDRGNLKAKEFMLLIKQLDRELNNETIEISSGKFIDINNYEAH
ncbi:MAG: hypothetical protein K8R40_08060 [Anaerolineaceae bacterium]|nr:hypothetical protein [Anaerolineaceae bacterium]